VETKVKKTQNAVFEEWWDFTSMYPQVKFRNSYLTASVFGALLTHWNVYGLSNGGLFRLVYLPCLSQMERRDGFITLFVIPLQGSHAWGQSLEISQKDTLELYIRTVAPRLMHLLCRIHTEYFHFHEQWQA